LNETPQVDKFKELARELEVEKDPSNSEEMARNIAPKGPRIR
jgi:hypothetical protein